MLLFAVTVQGGVAYAEDGQEEHKWRPDLGVEYTGEVQTDFHNNYNFLNLLRLHADLPVSASVSVRLATLSTATTHGEPLLSDIQAFSNLDAGDNIAMALSLGGVQWTHSSAGKDGREGASHTLFVGVHNMNEDCFTSDVTSLFTNSSCGIYPTISINYPIANYPVASLGMHYKLDTERWSLVGALYNGRGYSRFAGRNNVFRFCPRSDGLFALLQGEYRHRDSRYFVGVTAHHGELDEVPGRQLRSTLWSYAEQRLSSRLTLLAGYSHAFHSSSPCTDFACLGARLTWGRVECGLLTDYCRLQDDSEWATELTLKADITPHIYLQPALHLVVEPSYCAPALLIRLGMEF